MTKCLFVFSNAPLTEHYHGASARYAAAFKALISLNIDVHVLRLLDVNRINEIMSFEQTCESSVNNSIRYASSWKDISYTHPSAKGSSQLKVLASAYVQPVRFMFAEIEQIENEVENLILELRPDFIFSQMYPASALIYNLNTDTPWILGHHDWLYKYTGTQYSRKHLYSFLRSTIISKIRRMAEIRVLKKCTAVVAASISEAVELKNIGVQHVAVVPSIYDAVESPASDYLPSMPFRVIHLGQLQTISNSVGLIDYLNIVYPHLPKDWEFFVIGSTLNASPDLLDRLNKVNARVTNRIDKLSTILRPFDVAIIPFRHNLGERTKVPLLFNHAQVVVAHEAAVAGTPGLISGENCILLSDLQSFPHVLKKIAANPEMRRRIGNSARETFEKHFTMDAQLPAFRQLLETAGIRLQSSQSVLNI